MTWARLEDHPPLRPSWGTFGRSGGITPRYPVGAGCPYISSKASASTISPALRCAPFLEIRSSAQCKHIRFGGLAAAPAVEQCEKESPRTET